MTREKTNPDKAWFERSKQVAPDEVDQDALIYTDADYALAAIPENSKKKAYAITVEDSTVFVTATTAQAAKNKFLRLCDVVCRPVTRSGDFTHVGFSEDHRVSDTAIRALAIFLANRVHDKERERLEMKGQK